MSTQIILETEKVKAAFSSRDGRLEQLTSKLTGWELIRRPDLGLSFRLALPLPDKRCNLVLGEQQDLTRHELSPDGTELTLVWEQVTSEYGGVHDIEFHGFIKVTDDRLQFTAKVVNRSAFIVEVAAYPCLGDITPPAPDRKLIEISPVWNGGYKIELHPNFSHFEPYWGTDHLCQGLCWRPEHDCILLDDGNQGFYIGPVKAEPTHMQQWLFEQKPGVLDSLTRLPANTDTVSGHTATLEMMTHHFVFAGPGTESQLDGVNVSAYQGSWHHGMDLHKAWRETWFKRPKTPAWVEDVHAWFQIQINDAEENRNFQYKELPEIARECKEHGIAAIQITGWVEGGLDRGNPCHDTEPTLGTREEFTAAIQECHDMGVRIILMCKFTWMDESQPYYRDEGHKYAARDPYGVTYTREGWKYRTWVQLVGLNPRKHVFACFAHPAWRETIMREFKKAADLRPAGILNDEAQHHGGAKYCFADDHGHPTPVFNFSYDNQIARQFKAYTDTFDPDFLHIGEVLHESQTLEYAMAYDRFAIDSTHMRRYYDPFLPLMMAVSGFDDRNQINKCLQYRYVMSYEPFNFKGRPHDAPLTLAYGRTVDDLRRRYREFLWDAEFSGPRGAAITQDGDAFDDYTVFRNLQTGARAVAVTNTDAQSSITVHVQLDDNARARFAAVTPEDPDSQQTTGDVTIAPRSLIVLIEQL